MVGWASTPLHVFLAWYLFNEAQVVQLYFYCYHSAYSLYISPRRLNTNYRCCHGKPASVGWLSGNLVASDGHVWADKFLASCSKINWILCIWDFNVMCLFNLHEIKSFHIFSITQKIPFLYTEYDEIGSVSSQDNLKFFVTFYSVDTASLIFWALLSDFQPNSLSKEKRRLIRWSCFVCVCVWSIYFCFWTNSLDCHETW
jgi:hypothetical protein